MLNTPENKTKTQQIRELLHKFPDGLPTPNIATLLGFKNSTTFNALMTMPDCYIDRWVPSDLGGMMSAVWVAVEVPPHCPKPESKASRK